MLALNRQMCATSVTLSYFHVHIAINILRCFGYPREHNFGLVLILSPTGCTEGYVYFPQSCRNTHLPHFLDCLLNTTLIPCLLVCFLSILHERVCDYSGVQSSVTGILRMGDMNIHITWLTHVRTGPKKKNRAAGAVVRRRAINLRAYASVSYCAARMPNQLRRGHRAWPMFELKSGAAMAAPAAPMPPPLNYSTLKVSSWCGCSGYLIVSTSGD